MQLLRESTEGKETSELILMVLKRPPNLPGYGRPVRTFPGASASSPIHVNHVKAPGPGAFAGGQLGTSFCRNAQGGGPGIDGALGASGVEGGAGMGGPSGMGVPGAMGMRRTGYMGTGLTEGGIELRVPRLPIPTIDLSGTDTILSVDDVFGSPTGIRMLLDSYHS